MRAAGPAFPPGMALLSALCVLAFLPGCGSSSPAAISASSATTLHRDVQSIRSAAGENNAQKAHAAVGTLRRDISQLVARHELARSDARVLMIEAGQVDGRIAVEARAVSPAPASTPTTPTSTQPSPASLPAPSDGKGKGKGKDKSNGNGGNGNGDGGD